MARRRRTRSRRNPATSRRVYTGYVNRLGDEAVVHPGTSDWGERGWFVSVAKRIPGREEFITPKAFIGGTGERSKAEALATVERTAGNSWPLLGFRKANPRRGRRRRWRRRGNLSAEKHEWRARQLYRALAKTMGDAEAWLQRHSGRTAEEAAGWAPGTGYGPAEWSPLSGADRREGVRLLRRLVSQRTAVNAHATSARGDYEGPRLHQWHAELERADVLAREIQNAVGYAPGSLPNPKRRRRRRRRGSRGRRRT